MSESHQETLVEQIDQCLPQTQCTQCDYPRCRDYAEAIANGEAEINQCPPGGDVTIGYLANLLHKEPLPLDTSHGEHEYPLTARVIESQCIGCKLCIKACPVDCIVGAPKRMHTVISDECTGCKLCLPVCPTDCIIMVDRHDRVSGHTAPSPWPGFSRQQVDRARSNTALRLERIKAWESRKLEQKRVMKRQQMQQEILAAVRRKTENSE